MTTATALSAQYSKNSGFGKFMAFHFLDPLVEFPEKPLNGQNFAGRCISCSWHKFQVACNTTLSYDPLQPNLIPIIRHAFDYPAPKVKIRPNEHLGGDWMKIATNCIEKPGTGGEQPSVAIARRLVMEHFCYNDALSMAAGATTSNAVPLIATGIGCTVTPISFDTAYLTF